MKIQWYPGHMTKARRAMEDSIKLIDMIIELVDARLPISSRNPDIDQLGKQKSRMIILNKSDLADERMNQAWEDWFVSQGYYVVRLDSRSGSGMKKVQQTIQKACQEKIERDRRRGILNRPVRAMVAGIPNVGKSTFINSLAKKGCVKTGNKPGVTKGNQWIRLNKTVELLDTPGILWPKFEDEEVGIRLALVGSINDDVLNLTELAGHGISFLKKKYPIALSQRYPDLPDSDDTFVLLESIAAQRKCLKKGGEPDLDKAASIFLDEFRSGKLGRITLEFPEVSETKPQNPADDGDFRKEDNLPASDTKEEG
ncbi:MAG: ribosome biogenesis GTPase YlqF [Clostridiales bacterium]|nr:ribosome biogenesis GTPase YlqF [Clostridiales bacterium]